MPIWHENNNLKSFYAGFGLEYNVINLSIFKVNHMVKLKNGLKIWLQVVMLSLIWFAADALVRLFNLPLPANLTGMLLLLLLLFSRMVKIEWLRLGASWLLAEMLLFFVPAVVVVVNYQEMMKQEGVKIALVLVISTSLVIAVTAWVVDKTHRLERLLALRRRRASYVTRGH